MHRYASQTPEALELVGELEFVWDQVKQNTVLSSSSSTSSGPTHQSIGVPPFPSPQRSYGRGYSQRYFGNGGDGGGGDSKLRVLSPVSQPDAQYAQYQRSMQIPDGSADADADDNFYEDDGEDMEAEDPDDDEDEEEYEEARDETYDSDVKNVSSDGDEDESEFDQKRKRRRKLLGHDGNDGDGGGASGGGGATVGGGGGDGASPRLWRRRVEQALTSMTAEVAAVREQMEARTLSQRRRNGLWAWLKWLLWVTLRQIVWDVAMLGLILIWMRARGDRRMEERLRSGWAEVKAKVIRLGVFRKLTLLPP